ncbi:MAG: hypothetical protein RIC35_01795 [Marinoscillum sp.]
MFLRHVGWKPPAKAAYLHPQADTMVPFRNTHLVFVLSVISSGSSRIRTYSA